MMHLPYPQTHSSSLVCSLEEEHRGLQWWEGQALPWWPKSPEERLWAIRQRVQHLLFLFCIKQTELYCLCVYDWDEYLCKNLGYDLSHILSPFRDVWVKAIQITTKTQWDDLEMIWREILYYEHIYIAAAKINWEIHTYITQKNTKTIQ